MSQFKNTIIKTRSIKGVFLLTSRAILVQFINFVGYFFVTVFLERSELGIFIIVSAIIDILGYFSDIGLAAALVQKKKNPTIKEIRSTFTIQQILVLSIIIILLAFSPLIKRFYNLQQDGLVLLYAFAAAFFLSSLKTIPSVLLERKLAYFKVVVPQIVESLTFNLLIIILTWKGMGIVSYTWAVLARSILGTTTLYLIAPWKIGFNFSFKTLRSLLKFGVPYQLNTLLAVVKDKFMILLLGRIIGNDGIAIVGWAEKWSSMPLRYFLDNTVKVAFPTFSRLQHYHKQLKKAAEKVLYFLIVTILPAVTGISLLAKPLTFIIPRYSKWQPALIPLYLYSLASIFGSLAVYLTTIYNAIGKIKTTFKFMILWTVLTWIITPFLAIKLNFLGVAIATVIINSTSVIGIYIVKNYINLDVYNNIKKPIFANLIMMMMILVLKSLFTTYNLLSIFTVALAGFITYIFILLLIDNTRFLDEVKILFTGIRSKDLKK